MFLKKAGDFLVGIFFLIFSIIYYIASDMLPKSKLFTIVASFMPKIYALCLFIVALILAVNGYRKIKTFIAQKENDEYPPEYDRVIRVFCVFIAYVLLFNFLGFILSTFVFLIVEMIVFAPVNKRRKKDIITYIIISLFFSIILFYLFYYGFNILLPKGILKEII